MYYAKELFVKRGPLSTLWLAGSILRKVTKQQIVHADVGQLCDVVSAPPVALALPTQSTLLRGVVRIENKKAVYLLEDAEKAAGRLTEPRPRKEQTTVDPKKIRAKPDQITLQDTDELRLQEDQFATSEADYQMMADPEGDMSLFNLQQGAERMDIAEDLAYQGRAEDITLASQDFGDMSFSGDLEFHGMEEEIAAGDFGPPLEGGDVFGFGPGEIPPSPAAGGVEAPVEEEEDIFVGKRAGKAKKRKGAKAFVPVIDEETEISDNDLRAQIQSADDLLVERPILPPRIVGFHSLEQALMLPSYVDPSMHPVPSEIKEMLANECKIVPVIDAAGHTPAEAEDEFGPERAWMEEESSFGFGGGAAEMDISEGREREYEMMEAGVDAEMMDSMERTGMVAGDLDEGGLFADISQGPVEEGRRRTTGGKPIQVVSEMETPDLELPESQFEVLHEEVEIPKGARPTIERRAVNKHTEIFRSEIEKKFARLARQGAAMQIDFDKFLIELLNGNPNRRDRALAFYQLLVLASLEVIHVDQDVPMGAIIITKGTKYTVRWSSSQMFGSSTTPSQ